ncbi:MAG: PTS sugar transporter subunit IIB [Mycoplasmataceae bacterium]|nr:PTS sugar transporter subunit IIB [Mycoplasmataceae bacterium]
MKKICTVCGQGLGSSLIIEMNVNKAIMELGLNSSDFDVSHQNLNSYSKNDDYDLIICGEDLSDMIDEGNGKKIILTNLMDKNELKDKLAKELL